MDANMGIRGLEQEIEFLQGLKKRQILYIDLGDYLYTWGMPLKDGKILASASFNVSFKPQGKGSRARITGETGRKVASLIKSYCKSNGTVGLHDMIFSVSPDIANKLMWEPFYE